MLPSLVHEPKNTYRQLGSCFKYNTLGKFRDELQPKYENVKSSFILSSEYTYISLTKVKEIIRSCLKN